MRSSRIRTERWQNAIYELLADVGRARARLWEAEITLEQYANEPDEPERREMLDRFRAAGGEKAHEWARWLKGTWPSKPKSKPRAISRRAMPEPIIKRGPLTLTWVNPRPPKRPRDRGGGGSAA